MVLEDICDVYSGYAIKQFNEDKIGVPVIKIGNILMDGTIELEDCQYTTEKVNQKYYSEYQDIYIALSGATTGKIGILKRQEKFIVNQRVGIVRKKDNNIPIEFIKYFLFHHTDRIFKEAAGCAQPNISPKQIGKYKVPIIDDSRMKYVVEILDSLTRIINKRKSQLNYLDELIKARFVEMFGDPIRNTQNRSTVDVVDVVKMQRGFDLPVQERNQMGKIPVYGSNGVLGYHDIPKVKGGGIITGRSGTIGKVLYTESDYWPLNTTLFSADTYGNDVIYLSYLMEMYDLSRFIEGTGVPTLNRNKFHNKKIINVSINEQTQFSAFVKEVNKSKLLAASQPQIHIYKTLTLL